MIYERCRICGGVHEPGRHERERRARLVRRIGLVLVLATSAGLFAGAALSGVFGPPRLWWSRVVALFDAPPRPAEFGAPAATGTEGPSPGQPSVATSEGAGSEPGVVSPPSSAGAAVGTDPGTAPAEPRGTVGDSGRATRDGPRITIEVFPLPEDTLGENPPPRH